MKQTLFIWVVLLLLCLTANVMAAEPRPNIVVFTCDDHGWHDSAPYGARDVRTPNMQRLAADGMTLTHAFVASPACAPSRAALLTGLMPARNGAEANHSSPRGDIKKLPKYLQELGYDVAAFGKVAHYGHAPRYGFDHIDKEFDAATIKKFLDARDSKRPLCLFVGTHDPHVPWPDNHGYDPAKIEIPTTHVDTPETRQFRTRYYTAVTRADALLGEIYDLAGQQLGDNPLFIYTSDHGAQWPFGKWNLYDAGIRVPMLAVWPGVVQPRSSSAAMVSWVDILPTLVEVAGGKPPGDIDGRSFAGVLRGMADEHRQEIFSTHSGDGEMNIYPIRSIRTRELKYIRNLHPEYQYTTHIDLAKDRDGVKFWRTWVAAAQKNLEAVAIVGRYSRRPKEELYDLTADPHEQHNLAADYDRQADLKQLRAKLDAWMHEQNDQQTVFNKPRLLP